MTSALQRFDFGTVFGGDGTQVSEILSGPHHAMRPAGLGRGLGSTQSVSLRDVDVTRCA